MIWNCQKLNFPQIVFFSFFFPLPLPSPSPNPLIFLPPPRGGPQLYTGLLKCDHKSFTTSQLSSSSCIFAGTSQVWGRFNLFHFIGRKYTKLSLLFPFSWQIWGWSASFGVLDQGQRDRTRDNRGEARGSQRSTWNHQHLCLACQVYISSLVLFFWPSIIIDHDLVLDQGLVHFGVSNC